ncbi:MAG: hypothetical protein MH132_03960 [Hydrotalea sp.]|jgi:hypothetical protein|nr:hypothetical protein [Hydrotalea sp.]
MRCWKIISIIFLIVITGASSTYAQGVHIPEPSPEESIVVFIRPASMTAVLDNYIIRSGENEWCRISNNRFFYVAISNTDLQISAQRGNSGQSNAFQFQINKGAINYILCEVITKDNQPQMSMKLISKQSAIPILSKSKPDQCMLKVEMPERE